MKGKLKDFLIIVVPLLVISLLLYAQYSYSSKTKVANGLKYIGTVDVEDYYDTLIFSYKNNLIGFKSDNGISRWLVEGEKYDIEYKDKMWHRSYIKMIDLNESR